MPTNQQDTLVTVSIETRDIIKKLATKEGRTMKWIIETAIRSYYKKRKDV